MKFVFVLFALFVGSCAQPAGMTLTANGYYIASRCILVINCYDDRELRLVRVRVKETRR
jgi:hypothetical protein